MKLSVLQLNLFGNKYKDTLFPYLRNQSYDVLLLQEIVGRNTQFGNIDANRDTYQELQEILSDQYKSAMVITDRFTNSPDAYVAVGIFYKKSFSLLTRKEVFIHQYPGSFPAESKEYQKLSHAILELTLSMDKKQFTVLTTHGAWGGTPTEQEHQTRQGEIILDQLKSVSKPFIFTADLNIDPEQPTIKKLSHYSRNLITENKITNTLNPRTHAAQHMFPKGAAVDYIFVSNDINVTKFEVIQEDISDHLGLVAEIEI